MGDVSFMTYGGPDFDPILHEAFMLKIERVKFEHTNRYCKWKSMVSGGSLKGAASLPSFVSQPSLPLG